MAPSVPGLRTEHEDAAPGHLGRLEHFRQRAGIERRLIHRGACLQRQHEERRSAIHFLHWQVRVHHIGREAVGGGHPRRVRQRRAKRGRLLRHPRKRQAVAGPLELDERRPDVQPERERPGAGRDDAIVGESERGSDDRVAGKRHLAATAEDAQPDIGPGALGREHERRLREVGLPRHACHRVGGQSLGIEEDRQLVAGERAIGEDVVLQEPAAIGDRGASEGLSASGGAPSRDCETPGQAQPRTAREGPHAHGA